MAKDSVVKYPKDLESETSHWMLHWLIVKLLRDLTWYPCFDGYGVVGKPPISSRRVIDNKYSIKILTYRRQILRIWAKVWRTVLSIISDDEWKIRTHSLSLTQSIAQIALLWLTFLTGYFSHCPIYQLLPHRKSPYWRWTQQDRTTGTQCRGKSRRAASCARRIALDVCRSPLTPANCITNESHYIIMSEKCSRGADAEVKVVSLASSSPSLNHHSSAFPLLLSITT